VHGNAHSPRLPYKQSSAVPCSLAFKWHEYRFRQPYMLQQIQRFSVVAVELERDPLKPLLFLLCLTVYNYSYVAGLHATWSIHKQFTIYTGMADQRHAHEGSSNTCGMRLANQLGTGQPRTGTPPPRGAVGSLGQRSPPPLRHSPPYSTFSLLPARAELSCLRCRLQYVGHTPSLFDSLRNSLPTSSSTYPATFHTRFGCLPAGITSAPAGRH
jgi:hypothetical protein